MRKLIIALMLVVAPAWTQASSGAVHLDDPKIDLGDKESLRRGADTFIKYCLNCHSAQYMRYSRMAQDLGMSAEQVKSLLYTTDKPGETMFVAMRPQDAKAWFGTPPPDLSVIARARGDAWLYTYLRSFYVDEARPFGVNNVVFADVAMPHVLAGLQGLQKPVYHATTGEAGTKTIERLELMQPGSLAPAQYDALVRDLVGFLVYMSEPAKLQRYSLGPWVLLFLVFLTALLYALKREYWRDVH